MKLMLRVFGTWFVGLALVLVIIDGAKTFAANTVTTTSLAEMWNSLHAASWAAASDTVISLSEQISGQNFAEGFFGWPGWLIFGCFGALFLILGRQKLARRYLTPY